MSTWRERRTAIIEEYLRRANGDVDVAIQLLTDAMWELPTPTSGEDMLDLLNAREWLREGRL